MKILIDARLYGLENAGLGRYTINLVDQLIRIDKTNRYIILLRKKYYSELGFPKNWQKVLADFRHYTFTEQISVPLIIRKEKPDLVHFLHFNIPILNRIRYVVTIHDLLMQAHRGADATTLPRYAYYAKLIGSKIAFRHAVLSAAKIIVPTKTIKKEVIDFYKIPESDIVVTYEGFDDKMLSRQNSEAILLKYGLKDNPYFIYVGNAYPHKNLARAVKAIVQLNHQQSRKVMFAIIGSRSNFADKLKKLVESENAEDYVKLLGFVPDNDLGILYKNALGFLYPSLSEGFGLQGLEAISLGTILLASDIPVFREVYSDKALYFDPYETESIVNTMEKAVSMQSKDRLNMIKVGKAFIKKYSWSKMAKETLDVYEDVFKQR